MPGPFNETSEERVQKEFVKKALFALLKNLVTDRDSLVQILGQLDTLLADRDNLTNAVFARAYTILESGKGMARDLKEGIEIAQVDINQAAFSGMINPFVQDKLMGFLQSAKNGLVQFVEQLVGYQHQLDTASIVEPVVNAVVKDEMATWKKVLLSLGVAVSASLVTAGISRLLFKEKK